MVIEVNKDIDRYQESVAMGLTARQLIFSIASVIVGGGIVLLLYKYIGLTGSAYVAIPCVAPIALDRKSTRLNSSHANESRMPSSA